MDKVPISVIIPAKNEKTNIVPVINALKDWADEIYVVDSQSTDGMPDVVAELAKGAVAKIECVQFYFNGSYPKKKNWALDNLPIRNEWVLIVDADEVIPPALAEEIAEKVAHPDADGYYLHFLYMFLGRPIRHCGYASLRVLRLSATSSAVTRRCPRTARRTWATARRTSTSSWTARWAAA